MKKIISLLLAVIMLAGLLVSCADTGTGPSGQNDPSGAKDGTTIDISEVKAKGPEKIADGESLTIWVRDQSSCITDYENNLMTRWYEAKTGVKVKWIVSSSESAADRFTTSLASQDLPDIYNYYLTPADIMLYGGPNGAFLPLDDLIANGWMPNLAEYLKDNPIFDGLRSEDGKLYAIPTYSCSPHMLYVKKVWVKKDWLQQYLDNGGKRPETTTEFEDMLRYFKDNDMNGNGDPTDEVPMSGCQASGWGTDPFVWLLSPFALAIGDGYEQFLTADADGNVTYVGGTDEYRNGLRWAHALVEEGLLDEGCYTQDNGSYKQLVTDGILGVATGAEESQFCINVDEYSQWEAFPPVAGPTGLRQIPVYSKDYSSVNYTMAITKSCKNPEVAAKWIDYFFSEEGKIVGGCGFEGFNYELSDTPSLDGTVPSIVRYPDSDDNLNTRWGNRIPPDIDISGKLNYSEGSSARLYEAANVYEPYLTETGIPLIAFPLSTEEEARKSTAFDWVVMQTYYKGFRFITGRKDRDIVDGIQLDINNDEHWASFLKWVNTDGMLDEYIRLTEKKFFQKG